MKFLKWFQKDVNEQANFPQYVFTSCAQNKEHVKGNYLSKSLFGTVKNQLYTVLPHGGNISKYLLTTR
jgi:hypothetical protein